MNVLSYLKQGNGEFTFRKVALRNWDIHVVLQTVACLVFQKSYLAGLDLRIISKLFANGSYGRGKKFS